MMTDTFIGRKPIYENLESMHATILRDSLERGEEDVPKAKARPGSLKQFPGLRLHRRPASWREAHQRSAIVAQATSEELYHAWPSLKREGRHVLKSHPLAHWRFRSLSGTVRRLIFIVTSGQPRFDTVLPCS